YSTKKHQKLMDDINKAIKAFRESEEYPVLTKKWFND
ncbi:MAG: arginine-binding protein, partial [Erysipelotrichaceae bacterium]|nr:arginine-binding protein [Erysipelotrichaceae bacterium]